VEVCFIRALAFTNLGYVVKSDGSGDDDGG